MQTNYSNVYYIEDRFTHANIHNKLVNAKTVVILGDTFEAVEMANSAREYLDSVNKYHTKVILMMNERPQIRKSLGKNMEKKIAKLLKDNRISYLPNVKIKEMKGDSDLQSIHFYKEGDY